MIFRLMVKTHRKTGLKYLCYTKKTGDEFDSYLGSGLYWKRHLRMHGKDISTEILFETTVYEEFAKEARRVSEEFDVTRSEEWANLRNETGDGGDTVSNRIWITNGIEDKYWMKSDAIPAGWTRGRHNCVFRDPVKQRDFSSRRNNEKFSNSLKKAWADGKFDKRDHSKCGAKGENSPSKRPEMRQRFRDMAAQRSEEYYKKSGAASGAARLGKKRGPYRRKVDE